MPVDENLSVAEPIKNWRLGFWSLIATQFQGAFNENGLKSLVFFLILAMHLKPEEENSKVFFLNLLFSVPFILFSMIGGFLADRFSKRAVTIGTKLFEMAVMLLAMLAFGRENLPLALGAVFLASTQAAVFGPSKYGLLPELLPQKLLSWGNGVIELGTFLAIISAVVVAGFMSDAFRGHQAVSGLIFLGCSLVGLACAWTITRVPAADALKKFRANTFADLWAHGRLIRADRVLWLAVVGNTYFWFFGALLQNNVIFYGERILHLNSTHTGPLLASVAVGIGVGSVAAGYLSGGKIEYGLIPLGALGMTAFGFALSIHGLSST
jgi:acyl-[acyl-carrier-protein]-phospholipid O-acyltransferase/long-chain-fatty-acid--[acyl-carrier-protein] ligase